MGRKEARRMRIIHSIAEIPQFQSEEEEHIFWATHVMGDELFENVEPVSEEERQLLERARHERAARTTRQ